jgi:predicted amidophosphoribosyltransferase
VLLRTLASLVAPPLCIGCGASAGRREPLCGDCRAALRWLGPERTVAAGVPLWAPVAYDGPARALVRGLKFGGLARLAATMASQMAANAPPGWLDSGALVPVPLHPARLRKRGYNQASLLAHELSARTGLPIVDCLERRGDPTTQVGRGRSERMRGTPQIVAKPGVRMPAEVVLADDVATTGATLAACARACGAAFPGGVRAVAYARTPGR